MITSAFSLPQLLISLSLVGIVSLISIPALAKKSLVESETKKLMRALESVSMRALYRGESLTVHIEKQEIYTLKDTNPKKRILTRTLHPTVKIVSDRKELKFFPQGVASPASFVITDGDARCVLSLSLRGRVSYTCKTP